MSVAEAIELIISFGLLIATVIFGIQLSYYITFLALTVSTNFLNKY
ncbi:putative holin-like toxin [Tetragenococcus halophilus]|nr:putative holin-like toxin [Tetragenococcus halophilus]MCF1600833.1 putative holin-like toxin [Tetragenococcus halophilus]